MRKLAPIAVEVDSPPKDHPLVGSFRTTIERVALRRGVVLFSEGAGAAGDAPRVRVVLDDDAAGLECALVLEIASSRAVWSIPHEAFGHRIDGLERVQRLGSLLAAVLDLATTPEGRRLLAEDPIWTAPETTHALAGTAHLSVEALQEALTERLMARAAQLLVGELGEGRDWVFDDWALPPELDQAAIERELAAGRQADELREAALSAAEGLAREVSASVDQALATHGLAGLIPLQDAIARFVELVAADPSTSPTTTPTQPSDALVRAAEARLDSLPRPVPGGTLLSLAWAIPVGVLSAMALGPALEAPVAGSGHAFASLLGGAGFLALSSLAHGWSRLRRRFASNAVDTARDDYEAARARADSAERRALAPAIALAARSWFATALDAERARLVALEGHIRGFSRSLRIDDAGGRGSPAADSGDVAVDVSSAYALIDAAPEPLLQRVRAELAGPWRDALPTLLDLRRAARRLVGTPEHPPWVERSDVAEAVAPRLARALATLAGDQEQLVPRGLAVRRLALLPQPFGGYDLDLQVDRSLPSSREAHLIVAWRAP